jgi:hypothetical protein
MVDHDLARLVQEERHRELAELRHRRPPVAPLTTNRLARTIARRLEFAGLLTRHGNKQRASNTSTPALLIRTANPDDLPALTRLATLEEADVPVGPILLAVVDDQVEAALPLDGGRPLANPFADTAGLTELLRVRADQVAA